MLYCSEKHGFIKTKKTKDAIIKVCYEVDFTLFDGSIFMYHSFLIQKIMLRILPKKFFIFCFICFTLPRGYKTKRRSYA